MSKEVYALLGENIDLLYLLEFHLKFVGGGSYGKKLGRMKMAVCYQNAQNI